MSSITKWQSFRVQIESLVESVSEEIHNYPPPIPECDAQFNHLLELRQTLPQELARLEFVATDDSMSIEDFVRSSPCEDALSALLPDAE